MWVLTQEHYATPPPIQCYTLATHPKWPWDVGTPEMILWLGPVSVVCFSTLPAHSRLPVWAYLSFTFHFHLMQELLAWALNFSLQYCLNNTNSIFQTTYRALKLGMPLKVSGSIDEMLFQLRSLKKHGYKQRSFDIHLQLFMITNPYLSSFMYM